MEWVGDVASSAAALLGICLDMDLGDINGHLSALVLSLLLVQSCVNTYSHLCEDLEIATGSDSRTAPVYQSNLVGV